MDLPSSGTSIPESDLRTYARSQGSQQKTKPLDTAANDQLIHDESALFHSSYDFLGRPPQLSPVSNFWCGQSATKTALDSLTGLTRSQSNASDGRETLPNFQYQKTSYSRNFDSSMILGRPCGDCTSSNTTNIPHHHHQSGRLQGASAQLDGHFCCSWLNHDQPCFLCFLSAEALDDHIKSDHAGKNGCYRCFWQDCAKFDLSTSTYHATNFGNKPKLMRHVHSHTGYKPYPCPFAGCNKGFVTKEQLKNHETTHTKARKHRCEQCGKTFAVKSALTTHITAVHESRKIHKCDICGKAFADSSNLSKHKQTHFKSNAVSKRRCTRSDLNDGASTRTTTSTSTPSNPPATPGLAALRSRQCSTSLKSPIEKATGTNTKDSAIHPPSNPAASDYGDFNITPFPYFSRPESFDPNCYCCDHDCPPPEYCCEKECIAPAGLPILCDTPGVCDRSTICDLSGCFAPQHEVCTEGCVSTIASPSIPAMEQDSYLSAAQIQALTTYDFPQDWDAFSSRPVSNSGE